MATTDYQAAIDSNDVTMGYIAESQWGVTPASPTFKQIRLDSEGFSGSKSRTRPNEIDPSGQASAAITTKEESTGSLNFSVSAGTHNDLIAASLGSDFSTTGIATGFTSGATTTSMALKKYTGTDVAITTSAGNTCTLTATAGLFTTTNAAVVAGMRIKLVSVGTPAQGGTARVVSVAAASLVLADCSWTPADTLAAAMGSCTISSANTCTLTATDGLFQTTKAIAKGQFIKVYSATGTANRGVARVNTITSETVIELDMCSFVPAEQTGAQMGVTTIKGSMVRNGKVFTSFTFEKRLATALYLRYAGSMASGGSLDVGVGDYLKGTLSFLNKKEVSSVAALSGVAYTAPPTGTIIDSVKGIGTVWRGVDAGSSAGVPSPINGIVQKLGIKWNKEGAAAQTGIGSASAQGMRNGKQLITGTISTYFKDFALYDQYLNEQTGPISFYALDGLPDASTTKGYIITFCNATIMNPKVVAGGPGQDIMADFEVEGNPDVTNMHGGKTIQIDYFN